MKFSEYIDKILERLAFFEFEESNGNPFARIANMEGAE